MLVLWFEKENKAYCSTGRFALKPGLHPYSRNNHKHMFPTMFQRRFYIALNIPVAKFERSMLYLHEDEAEEGGGQLPVETRYTCTPWVTDKIKKILPWL